MNDYRCILCLGSNTNAEMQMANAREALLSFFPDIRFSTLQETEAIGSTFHSPFLNQIAVFHTHLSAPVIREMLKEIEKRAGRQAQDKAQGIVTIDIDLIKHGKRILKKDDYQRDFVQQGISELSESD